MKKDKQSATKNNNSPNLDRLERGKNVKNEPEDLQKPENIVKEVDSTVNHNYKYDDYDMRLLLPIYAQEAKLKTKIKTEALEPITAEQLSTALEGDTSKEIPRKVMIACNLGGRHWVGIGIRIGKEKIEVEYMDSIPNKNVPAEIVDQLKHHYGNKIVIKSVSRLMQSDSVSCGPLCLKNLSSFAKDKPIKEHQFASKESVAPIRKQQIKDATPYNSDFANKQLKDQSIVASNETYNHYMVKLHLRNYTNAEVEQIANLVEQYQKIEDKAIKTKILKVFNDAAVKDHKTYFSRIRNLFNELRKAGDLSRKDAEGINGIMQIMFGKNLEEAKQLSKPAFKGLSTRILSYEALINLFANFVIEKEDMEILLSTFKDELKMSKERLAEAVDRLKLTHTLYLNIINTIKSSDTWYEKITTENILFMFSALTITVSAAISEIKNEGWQIAGSVINWFGVMASVAVTIPQTKKAFFEDFETTLRRIKDELKDFPEISEIFETRFKAEDFKEHLNWQRGIALTATLLTIGGLALNLTQDVFFAKLLSIIVAGLASTMGLVTAVHHIGKIATGAKKIASIDTAIQHAKIKILQKESERKDQIIEELNKRIEKYERDQAKEKESALPVNTDTYKSKVEKYQSKSPREEKKFQALRQRHSPDVKTKQQTQGSPRENTTSYKYQ